MKLCTYEMTVECQKYQSPPKNCQYQWSDVYMYKQQYDKNGKIKYLLLNLYFYMLLWCDNAGSRIHIPVFVFAVTTRLQDVL